MAAGRPLSKFQDSYPSNQALSTLRIKIRLSNGEEQELNIGDSITFRGELCRVIRLLGKNTVAYALRSTTGAIYPIMACPATPPPH